MGAPLQRANVGTIRLIPVKIPIASLCEPLGGLRACTAGGLYVGFMETAEAMGSSDSSCTAASCLPPPGEEEAEW